jgi:hypothetical protein
MLVATHARHGSRTRITAVRMSVTAAMSGVATMGNPNPSAPCTSPASMSTRNTHTTMVGDSDSNPGMKT